MQIKIDLLLCVILSLSSVLLANGQELDSRFDVADSGHCTSHTSTIHVTKEELDEAGNIVRTCEGDESVWKCEGTCSSQSRPSVASPSGLLKVRPFRSL